MPVDLGCTKNIPLGSTHGPSGAVKNSSTVRSSMYSERGQFFTLERSVSDPGLLRCSPRIRRKHAQNADLELKRLLAIRSNSELDSSGFSQPKNSLVKMIDLGSDAAVCTTDGAE